MKRGKVVPLSTGEVVVVGFPMDTTVTNRSGTRWGPARIRENKEALEDYSPYLKKTVTSSTYEDLGDLELPFGNVEKSLDMIKQSIRDLLAKGQWPLSLGGEHLVTFPIVEAMLEYYPDLVVVQLDAHADLCDSYRGEKLSHATVMRRIVERMGSGKRLYQLGIRSWTKEEEEYAQENQVRQYPLMGDIEVPASMQIGACLADLPRNVPIYLTLDVDVLDPAYAPGTGTPEPGGLTTTQLLSFLHHLFYRGHTIVGADLVEVAPDLDPTGQTGVLGAKLLREMVLGLPMERR